MKHLGITGTRKAITEKQYSSLRSLMYLWSKIATDPSLHHGDCLGADYASCLLGNEFGYHIICHPPIENGYRSRSLDIIPDQEVREPKEYLDRNDDIASECDVLIGLSSTYFEVSRSGTWATIRYAKAKGKIVIVIWPDGSVQLK